MIKMIINTITQIREKARNATQDKKNLKGESKTSRRLKAKTETE